MFSSGVKNAEVTPIFQKGLKIKVENYRPVIFYPMHQSYLKCLYLITYFHTLVKFYQTIKANFEKALILSAVSEP